MDNFIFLPDRSKVSAGNSATGELSVALGQHCTASGDYSLADGSGCTASTTCSVALGNAADASGTCGFMYRDMCGNTFCFDSGGPDSSGQFLINGKPIGGGGSLLTGPPIHGRVMVDSNYSQGPDPSEGGGLFSLEMITGIPQEVIQASANATPPRQWVDRIGQSGNCPRVKVTLIGNGGWGAQGTGEGTTSGMGFPASTVLSGGGGGSGAWAIFSTSGEKLKEGWTLKGQLNLGDTGRCTGNGGGPGSDCPPLSWTNWGAVSQFVPLTHGSNPPPGFWGCGGGGMAAWPTLGVCTGEPWAAGGAGGILNLANLWQGGNALGFSLDWSGNGIDGEFGQLGERGPTDDGLMMIGANGGKGASTALDPMWTNGDIPVLDPRSDYTNNAEVNGQYAAGDASGNANNIAATSLCGFSYALPIIPVVLGGTGGLGGNGGLRPVYQGPSQPPLVPMTDGLNGVYGSGGGGGAAQGDAGGQGSGTIAGAGGNGVLIVEWWI